MLNFGKNSFPICFALICMGLVVSPMPNESTTYAPITTDVPSNVPWSEDQTNSNNEVNVGLEYPLLPMVINSWKHTEGNEHAWYILNRTPGGLGETRNAVVEGCGKCEEIQSLVSVGYGGAANEDGETILHAMIMDGATMDVGAVGGLRRIKNAIRVARHVLENTQHTMLVGDLATEFGQSMGFKVESLTTNGSTNMWQNWVDKKCQPNFWRNVYPDPKTTCGPYKPKPTTISSVKKNDDQTDYNIGPDNHDTIGIVAIDVNHQIHVGTSTNGLDFSIPARVADSSIPGAGAYADNEVGAATATGNGDIMMRFLPSLLAVEAMRVGKTPAEAAEMGIQRILKYHKDFYGAIIAVNRLGEYGVCCHGWEDFSIVVSSPVKSGPITRTETVKCLPRSGPIDFTGSSANF
ncbi:putative N(4)-(beta-N-acetylglucosaminyl)-L-asparaginase GD10667 [Drosophila tropicalis]|uniref:putative N(4)-(beta-N-acetylglucosaminyl)-L-asparaginase GD10667 n=1 Tax=Drosophila tropicalis TaxID=46794 RepID=UPI0035ABFBDC